MEELADALLVMRAVLAVQPALQCGQRRRAVVGKRQQIQNVDIRVRGHAERAVVNRDRAEDRSARVRCDRRFATVCDCQVLQRSLERRVDGQRATGIDRYRAFFACVGVGHHAVAVGIPSIVGTGKRAAKYARQHDGFGADFEIQRACRRTGRRPSR
ncbi:hypothetical protein SDC9_113199 [bioreactor metagenome]|uniref:Uncharacterized protein n=1 Tax=bioreactor metagenome TaxID=1076179 RepID=A0A645BM84_9ZZZZ